MPGQHGRTHGKRFLDTIDGFNEMKDYIENESRLEHGKRVITDNAKVDSREITLQLPSKEIRRTTIGQRRNLFRPNWKKVQ